MYVVKLYYDNGQLIDIWGDFKTKEEAEKWIRENLYDNQYGKIINIGERK